MCMVGLGVGFDGGADGRGLRGRVGGVLGLTGGGFWVNVWEVGARGQLRISFRTRGGAWHKPLLLIMCVCRRRH